MLWRGALAGCSGGETSKKPEFLAGCFGGEAGKRPARSQEEASKRPARGQQEASSGGISGEVLWRDALAGCDCFWSFKSFPSRLGASQTISGHLGAVILLARCVALLNQPITMPSVNFSRSCPFGKMCGPTKSNP